MSDIKSLLLSGSTYDEISKITGIPRKRVAEKNRLHFKIDLLQAFNKKIEREGIPNKYIAGKSFADWFSGYFDGEGCFVIYYRIRKNNQIERRLGLQIACRLDDLNTLEHIQTNLGGKITFRDHQNNKHIGNPSCLWRIQNINELMEMIIPLFESSRLFTKKKEEYKIWKSLVIRQYHRTLGGKVNNLKKFSVDNNIDEDFIRALELIHDIRHPFEKITSNG